MKIPDRGFCFATTSGGYIECTGTTSKRQASFHAQRIANHTRKRVDLVEVRNRGEDRFTIREFFPRPPRRRRRR